MRRCRIRDALTSIGCTLVLPRDRYGDSYRSIELFFIILSKFQVQPIHVQSGRLIRSIVTVSYRFKRFAALSRLLRFTNNELLNLQTWKKHVEHGKLENMPVICHP